MSLSVIGFIFARGGSKGIPRKNIKKLAGKPLIAYAIECGLRSSLVQRVMVSTEDSEIAEVARRYGAEVPFMRPAALAQDDSPEWLAWRHALETMASLQDYPPVEVFAAIPTTSPLRTPEDLDACIQALLDSGSDLAITVTPAARNPYFNQVVVGHNGRASLVIPTNQRVDFRQSAPVVYDMATVAYAARPAYVLEADNMWEGKVTAVTIPPERALDIDTDLDFRIAEFLMGQNGNQT
ncbi:MAG: acylneuraminate cytidylyltransferase family protein [Desulfarculaceae bacterium]|jgi:N-acylneuraminate cytidylyltransferase